MGQMRFRVPNAKAYDPRIWNNAFISSYDGFPWPCVNRVENDCLIIERSENESGKVSVVWPTREYGPILLTSGSLRCVEEPYLLPLELARGTIHRIRSRGLNWQCVGLKLPEAYTTLIDQSITQFIQAAVSKSDVQRCCELSQESIDLAISASRPLARAFVSQSLQARHAVEKQFSTLLGVRAATDPTWNSSVEAALPAINTLNVSMEMGQMDSDVRKEQIQRIDAQLEWARAHSLRVFGGPLINLQPHAFPKWYYLYSDFDSLLKSACEHAKVMVERYRGQVHLWSAASGLNAPNAIGLSDEQVQKLAISVIQTVRRCDPKTPVIICIDAPWAEYLSHHADGISPLIFAEALIRVDLGLSGIGLELNFNAWPNGSLPRDLIDLSDMIDHWGNALEMPLLAMVSNPSNAMVDDLATSKSQIVSTWSYPDFQEESGPDAFDAEDDAQKSVPELRFPANGMDILQMLLAKTRIHGIIWNQISDQIQHPFPNAGLISQQGKPRSLLDGLIRLRQLHVH